MAFMLAASGSFELQPPTASITCRSRRTCWTVTSPWPRPIGRGHGEVTVQQVRRDRQVMLAVGGCNSKLPLAASMNAMLPHQPLHPLLAHANALHPQLPPDARPSVRSAILRIHGADMHQQRFIAQVAASRDLLAPRQMLVITRDTYKQHPTLHSDGPDQLVTLNKGVLHRWPCLLYTSPSPRD